MKKPDDVEPSTSSRASLEERHAFLKRLSRAESAVLGVTVGALDQIITMPLLYWKNCAQQSLPLRLHPRFVYRGVTVACINAGAMVSVQFLAVSRLQAEFSRMYLDGGALTPRYELASGFLGGALSGVIISCFELLMIQQQNFGGSLVGTLRSLTASHGGMGVLMRAAPMASGREACFAASYVGAVPIAQRYLSSQHGMHQTAAALVGSIGSGLLATMLSHPLDIIKTNMQGNLTSPAWRTMTSAASTLYKTHGAAYIFTAGLFWRASRNICSVFIFNELKTRLGPRMFPHVFDGR